MLILAMISATVLSTTAFADSFSAPTHEFDYSNFVLNFEMTPTITYSSNTSSSITVNSLSMKLNNISGSALVNFAFRAWNGNGIGNNKNVTGDEVSDNFFLHLAPGENTTVKIEDWSEEIGYSSTYSKGTSGAIFEFSAGHAYMGTMQVWAATDKTFLTYAQGQAINSTTPEIMKSGEETEVAFNNFGTTFVSEYSTDTVQSSDHLDYIESLSPKLVDSDGQKYTMQLESLENGAASYSVDMPSESLTDAQIVSPVFYLEQSCSTVNIPLSASADSPLETVEVLSAGDNADDYIAIEFTTLDSEHVPYNMVLVTNGTEYKPSISMHYFDNDTGEFIRGCLIFKQLSLSDITDDAYFASSSSLNRYSPTIIS